jgi:AAA ATPase domain
VEPSIYTPGAGHRPPLLAGRDALLQAWRLTLNDVAVRGRVGARDRILAGPRGIGKTAALLAFGDICRDQGYEVVNLQAAAGSAGLVDSLLAEARERVEAGAGAWQRAKRGFDRIAGVNVSVVGFGGGISTHAPRDTAGSVSASSLARALSELADAVRQDAPGGGVLITIDEMQVAAPDDLALLAAALQRLNADHPHAGVLFAGSGLPHMPEVLRQAHVTHPDRLFDIRQVPLTLSPEDARYALIEPAQRLRQVHWEPDAAGMIVDATNGYPAHLQLFADHAWRAANPDADTITVADAQYGLTSAAEELEERTLGPRLDRLTDRQAELLAAVAIHGGAVATKDLTSTLQRESSTNYSRTRDELITEGDLYAPRRGALALTVPLMRPYLLAHYDEICARANVAILTLKELQRGTG